MRRLWGDDADERMGGNGGEELDQQVAAGVFAPVVGRDIGEFWPEGDEGARTPGRGHNCFDEGMEEEAEELDDPILESWKGADQERAQDKVGEAWAVDMAQDIAAEDWAEDLAGEGGGADESGGSRKGGSGGVGGLLGKGMGGKGGGRGSGAAAGMGMVNATIRKPA